MHIRLDHIELHVVSARLRILFAIADDLYFMDGILQQRARVNGLMPQLGTVIWIHSGRIFAVDIDIELTGHRFPVTDDRKAVPAERERIAMIRRVLAILRRAVMIIAAIEQIVITAFFDPVARIHDLRIHIIEICHISDILFQLGRRVAQMQLTHFALFHPQVAFFDLDALFDLAIERFF